MEFHALAEVLPLMEGEPFAELVADIKEHGLREPIVVFEGKILDGRNRFRACTKLRIQPELEYFKGGDPVAFVMSMNVHRRHLNESQRAMIAARLATLKRGANQHRPIGLSTEEAAAALLNVAPRTVRRAKLVLHDGTPDEVAAIERGEKAVSAVAKTISSRKYARERYAAGKAAVGEDVLTSGARLIPPEGVTVEQWCRSGMQQERDGKPAEEIANTIGMSCNSYRKVRDIIRLADRDDLPPKEADLVRQSLASINKTRRLRASYEPLRPIISRVWGKRKGVAESRRVERFEHAIGIIVQACATGSHIDVPHVGGELAADLAAQLEQARRQLATIITALKDIYQ